MLNNNRVRLIGVTGSPYTRKMLALLRYRRIPSNMIWGDPARKLEELGVAPPKIIFQPTFLFQDEAGKLEAVCDSTPIIGRLEGMYEGRSVVPPDPALAFVDYLLEDFGDEWCTKYMFHYRWHFEEDAENAGTMLGLYQDISMPDEQLAQFKSEFTNRQVGRLSYVGSNNETAPIIDASYRRLLTLLEAHFRNLPFLLGNRPGSADFALMGQLTQLVGVEPTSRAITHELSPRTAAWVSTMEDQSGLEPSVEDWCTVPTLPSSLKSLLGEVGRVYVPALLANAAALAAGEENWQAEIDGCDWSQQTFTYHGKCLHWIRDKYFALSTDDRCRVNELLDGTGCEALFLDKQGSGD